MRKTKIVYIGAGSADFGLNLLGDIFYTDDLNGSTLWLVDIDQENLDRMYNLAVKMNEESESGLTIKKTRKRKEALPGAKFVINSIAIKRNELWKKDFQIPNKYGIRQTLGENGGPGGLFFTMRTIPIIMDIVRDMEALCPDAYFLNFSNPESRNILALGRYTDIKCLGLCHGVFMGRNIIHKMTGLKEEEIEVFAAGINHFQWFLKLRKKGTNEDIYPLLREKDKEYDPSFMPLSRKLFRAYGYFPSCSDDHIGEYLPYGWEGGEEGYDFDAAEEHRDKIIAEIHDRLDNDKLVDKWIKPSGEKAIEVITAILYEKDKWIESGIVYNDSKYIENLPADLAVEVPLSIHNGQITPFKIGKLPAGIANLLKMQAGVQQLAVDAAVNASKKLAYQALLADPVVNCTDAAQKLLDELWEINKPYIRECL